MKKATTKKRSSEGINKTTGKLKKGYRYNSAGRVVKAKAKTKATARKRKAKKK